MQFDLSPLKLYIVQGLDIVMTNFPKLKLLVNNNWKRGFAEDLITEKMSYLGHSGLSLLNDGPFLGNTLDLNI